MVQNMYMVAIELSRGLRSCNGILGLLCGLQWQYL